MVPDAKNPTPAPGRDVDERGSRYAQDLPGAARGDRRKYKEMIFGGKVPPEHIPQNPADDPPIRHAGDADESAGMAGTSGKKPS